MICLSNGGTMVYLSDKPSTKLLIGTTEGVVSLQRAGAAWQTAGKSLDGKHVSSLVIDNETKTVFAGLSRGGVQASRDGGKTWAAKAKGLGEADVYSAECGPQRRGIETLLRDRAGTSL